MSKTIANPYENFIALSRYARWISEDNRRETWGETVDRYFGFMLNHLKENYNYIPDEKLVAELKNGVFERNVMPSMRSVMTSGAALERDNVAGYNCAFLPVDSPRSFDETMYILMCGTGVGFEGVGLKKAWSIAKRESNGRPLAYNGDKKTGDSSYGIFQINMIGDLGPTRLEKFDLKSNKELFDPVTNAEIT